MFPAFVPSKRRLSSGGTIYRNHDSPDVTRLITPGLVRCSSPCLNRIIDTSDHILGTTLLFIQGRIIDRPLAERDCPYVNRASVGHTVTLRALCKVDCDCLLSEVFLYMLQDLAVGLLPYSSDFCGTDTRTEKVRL